MQRKRSPRSVLLILLILLCGVGWAFYRAAHQSALDHALILASATGDPIEVRALLAQGADPNTMESNTQRMGWRHFRDVLLRRTQSSFVVCPLSQALNSDPPNTGTVEIVRLLLKQGADPNIKLPGSTPLPIRAVTEAQDDRLPALFLQYGADPNTVDGSKFGPSRNSLLLYAVEAEKLSLAQLLLEHGAKPDLADADGDCPLMWATLYEETRMVQLLLSHHADVNHKNSRGQTALTYALETRVPKQLEITGMLIAAGADVNALDRQGCTPFLFALANYSPSIELMLAHGADLRTAIPLSAPTQLFSIDITPQRSDTTTNRTSSLTPGMTPLMIAVQFHKARLVRRMLALGADVNARNPLGKTALDYAQNDSEKHALLERAGARP